MTEGYLTNLISAPTDGELAFVIVLPLSTSSIEASITSSTTPVATTMDEGNVIGHAGIWHVPRNELVFMITDAYWNQGYMVEVLVALVPISWRKELKKVGADVNPENEASLKGLRKSGFKQVGNNIIEPFAGRCESLRMELTNPNDGGQEDGDVELADDGSDSSSGDNARV